MTEVTEKKKSKCGRRSKEYLALKSEIEANQLALEVSMRKQIELEAEIQAKKSMIALLEKIIGKL